MAKYIYRPSPVLGDRKIRTLQVRTLVESDQWLKNWYLSVHRLALCITRIGQGTVELGRPIIHDWDFPCLTLLSPVSSLHRHWPLLIVRREHLSNITHSVQVAAFICTKREAALRWQALFTGYSSTKLVPHVFFCRNIWLACSPLCLLRGGGIHVIV